MRSTVAVIDRGNLHHNFLSIKKLVPKAGIIAIVKANAYGHGMVEISKALETEGVDMFGVAFAEEGVKLREAGINKPIIVLVPGNGNSVELFGKYELHAAISSVQYAKSLSDIAGKQNKTVNVHLFINTGMNRDGVLPEEAIDFASGCSQLPNIKIVGLCSHFATADSHPEFARKQLAEFNRTLKLLQDAGFSFEYIHLSNTAGLVNFPEAHFTHVRPGLSFYGYSPAPDIADKLNVKPIMTLKTKVILTRRINEGDTVGYGMKFIADKPTNIATISIGYGDGYSRLLNAKAMCLINGKRYKIVGTICMDECMIDTGDDDIKIGDEVILIGYQGAESILADEIAESIGTIPYEITTSLTERVPRIYV